MKIRITLVLLLLFNASVFAQQTCTARYSGLYTGLDDKGFHMAVDNEGYVYVNGESDGDMITLKYDNQCNLIWQVRYNGGANSIDKGHGIAVDNQGGVYVTGEIIDFFPYKDYYTAKYNSDNGRIVWWIKYNGPVSRDDVPHGIAIDNVGNTYVTGSSTGTNYQGDFTTIRYDQYGNEIWVKRYHGPGSGTDEANAIVFDYGFVYVTGQSYGINTNLDFATIQYRAENGFEEWSARFNNIDNSLDYANDLDVGSFDGVYVTGASTKNSGLYFTVIKYDVLGAQVWLKDETLGRGNSIALYERPCGEGDSPCKIYDPYVAGTKINTSGDIFTTDFYTLRFDAYGNLVWEDSYQYLICVANSIAVDGYGNAYVTGYSTASNTFEDYLTIKYDKFGNRFWAYTYNGPANRSDLGRDVVFDAYGNCYVTGGSWNSAYEIATLQYASSDNNLVFAPSAGSPEFPTRYFLMQNYPNPFNPCTRINYSLPKTCFVTLKVFDVMGNEVSVLVNENRTAGNYSNIFDASQLSSGVYFYKLEAGNYTDTKKMVLLK